MGHVTLLSSESEIIKQATLLTLWKHTLVPSFFGVWNYQTSRVIEAVGIGPCYISLFGVWNYQISCVIGAVGTGPCYTSFFGVWNYQTSHVIQVVGIGPCYNSFFGVWKYQKSPVIEGQAVLVTLLSREGNFSQRLKFIKQFTCNCTKPVSDTVVTLYTPSILDLSVATLLYLS